MDKTAMGQAIDTLQTPFYVFDTDEAAAQVTTLRTAFGPEIGLCYAMKANAFVVGSLIPWVDYFEVCSPGEFRICQRTGIPPEKIVLSGVYKKPAELDEVMETCGSAITYTAESLAQWQQLSAYATVHQCPLRVLLRLTAGNQFGMEQEVLEEIVAHRDDSFAHIEGIQYFSGTQKKNPTRWAEELEKLDALLETLFSRYGFTAEKLEYGTGLPVTYFEGEKDEEQSSLDALAALLRQMRFGGKIVLETGRRVAASCGTYFTRVADVKRNHGSRYCIVDGGIHHLNYFGQMMAMKKPPLLQWNAPQGEGEPWTVCGSLCTSNDVLLKSCSFTDLRVGDVLVFGKAGAYSPTESIGLFLSRDLPQVALFSREKGLRLVREALPTDRLNSSL
ncbi:MAG: alanine racemase [Oscillibacter sp.]|nr:alanine racemase [Oscillibacter sp.]